jgi:hypothetical protein
MRALTPGSWNFFHLSEAKSTEISMIAHPHEYSQLHFHAHILSERVGYTRGQIIDMAFLGGGWPKPDGSVMLSSTDSEKVCSSSQVLYHLFFFFGSKNNNMDFLPSWFVSLWLLFVLFLLTCASLVPYS